MTIAFHKPLTLMSDIMLSPVKKGSFIFLALLAIHFILCFGYFIFFSIYFNFLKTDYFVTNLPEMLESDSDVLPL